MRTENGLDFIIMRSQGHVPDHIIAKFREKVKNAN
jgi:hypothetical protein